MWCLELTLRTQLTKDAGRGITVPSTNRAITWPRYYRYIYLCDIKCHKLAGSALKHPLPDVSITPSIACSLYNSTILIQSLWLTVLSDKNQQEFLHPGDKTWQGRDLSFWGGPGAEVWQLSPTFRISFTSLLALILCSINHSAVHLCRKNVHKKKCCYTFWCYNIFS